MLNSLINKTKALITVRHMDQDHDGIHYARRYIANYWPKLERYHPKDDDTLIGLPQPYLVPAFETGHSFEFDEMYYWDSYFMIQGLLDENHQQLVMGILENMLHLQKRYGIIPNASRTYLMGRSQPPLLTSLIFDIYDAYHPGKDWLKRVIAAAEQEYADVWMGKAKPNWRQVHRGLSRYYDINMIHDLAETESGWDMTPRFGRKCLDYLPIDLNTMLYKYETDFVRAAQILGNAEAEAKWHKAAHKRSKTINELMWDKGRGFYYDYNYVKERRGNVSSLAGYFPMWAGLTSIKQARAMVKNLRRFEQAGGLTVTDKQLGALVPGTTPTQWAYPNGWAPMHFIVIKALQLYGYDYEARRIANKWLKTNLNWYKTNDVFLEKYNVVSPDKPPTKGLYPTPTGFGWTNAIFERLCQEYID